MLIHPFVGHVVIIFSTIARRSCRSRTRNSTATERTEMSAELLIHERWEIFHASRNLEIIARIFRTILIITRSVTIFNGLSLANVWCRSLDRRRSFRMSNFRFFTAIGSDTNFVFLNGWNFFGCSRWRCFTVGAADDVTIFSWECRRNNVPCNFTVQRWVQVSIALNVATASNGNLQKKKPPQKTAHQFRRIMICK